MVNTSANSAMAGALARAYAMLSIGHARAAIGLLQGLALYALYQATVSKTWPATDGYIFAPLLVLTLNVPLIAIAGLGNLRPRTLILWIVAASALCVGLAFYDIFRDPLARFASGATDLRLVPTFSFWFAVSAALFITHSLIVASDADRKIIANYPAYFDVSWKHGVQAVLIALFVLVLWGMLFLGAELFKLIKLEFLSELIRKPWFWLPVSALAVSYAIHITDDRAGLVRGARTLKLTLLSWLLPLMAAIAAAFVVALPFTGLEPLWNTRHATSILLIAAAALVFLINATYQDGSAQRHLPALLRLSSPVAAAILVPLVAIAGYGLFLRVQQYGWTPDRIFALACVVVAACYALGYTVAAARSRTTMKELERTNIVAAFVIVAVLVALFSPLADPARISVADQIARLRDGRVPPEKFDFVFLRFDAGRYGKAELERLASLADGPQAAAIAEKAKTVLRQTNRYTARRDAVRRTPEARAANITVIHPAGQPLPDGFVEQTWDAERYDLPRCLAYDAKCEAIVSDLDDDGLPELILLNLHSNSGGVFKQTSSVWAFIGPLANTHCPGVREALRTNRFEITQPKFKEIRVAEYRLYITNNCPVPFVGIH